MKPLIELIMPYSTVSIIGLSKNAGKTTALNYIIEKYSRLNTTLGLTGIGRDGEDTDIVTHTKKPRIFVDKGTIVATAEGLLPLCDITFSVVSVTEYTTSLGRIVIVKAESAGYVQLGGPSISGQLKKLTKEMRVLGAEKIIIDGSINRKSQAAQSIDEDGSAAILCTGAALSPNMDIVTAQTVHALSLLTLPKFDDNSASEDERIYCCGMVSDKKIRDLIMSGIGMQGKYIIADDPSKIFISEDTYAKLLIKGGILTVQKPMNIAAITVNPTSPQGFAFCPKEFIEKIRCKVNVPVYDVKLEEAAHDGIE